MLQRLSRSFVLLLALCLATPAALAQVAGLTEGIDYRVIADGAPYRPLEGKVEIAEVFAYGCRHCADMAPKLEAWKRTLPANVRVTYVPAAWRSNDPWTQAFFAAETSGALAASHEAMFRAVHVDRALPGNATLTELGSFYGALPGVDGKAFAAALRDIDAINAKAENAHAFVVRSGIEGTPSIVVNGRYLVLGTSHEGLLANAARIAAALAPAQTRPSTTRKAR